MKYRWLRTVMVIVLVVAAIGVIRFTVFRPEPVPVTVFRAARGVVEETVTNSKAGTVKTRQRASLSTEIGGRVSLLPVHEGDRVRAGQTLLEVASEDYAAQVRLQERSLEASEAGREEACTAARQAQKELERYTRLAEEEIVSEALLDQYVSSRDTAVSACEAARARVLEAKAALAVARVHLDKTVLRAPFDGVVAEVTTEVGEWVTPSPPGLMIPAVIEILDNESIYVSAPLDEVDVGKVRVGQIVRVTLDAYPDRAFDATLSRVAPFVLDLEEQNRTFEVEVEFDDRAFATTLLPGSSADVEVILDARVDVLRIPSYALMEGNHVLLHEGDVLVEREVETGLKNWAFAEIVSGLEGGELVVVSLDRLEVQAGARARVDSETLK